MDKQPSLGTDVEAALNGLVDSGRYASREQVLREGVRLVQDRESRLSRVDAAVARGIEDAEAGRSEDAEAVLGRLRRKYEAIAAKPAA
jgi:antitoxin ParD1/3/4